MINRDNSLNKILTGIIVVYVVVTLLILAASYVIPQPEAEGILRTLFGLLLFPSLILLPVTLLLRRWALALLMVPAVIVWGVVYGSLLLPRTVDVPETAADLSVLTFNVQTASEDLQSISDLIARADADIVALQELSEPTAAHLENVLAEMYPHRALHPSRNPHWGQGIMSRFPINEHEYWRNEQIDVAQGHMWAELELESGPITVFSTHPVPPISFEKGITLQPHSREISILLERAAEHETPLLLVGDFNMTQLMDEYNLVTEQYVDTYRQVGDPGFGFTFPAGQRIPLPPVLRLDYVFHSAEFEGVIAYPLPHETESDHLPVYAELVLMQ